MASARPPPRSRENNTDLPPQRGDQYIDIDALLEENDRLKRLVVQLSRLVLKNVVDRA